MVTRRSRQRMCLSCKNPAMLRMGNGGVELNLVDVREHRFQLGVVGILVLVLTSVRKPKLVAALAVVTAFPVLPAVFRRYVAPRLPPASGVEDGRLPAFARVAGGVGLMASAGLAAVAPSRVSFAVLFAAGGVCIYGGATGYCVPCNVLLTLEKAGVVSLDPPLVCAVRT